MATRKRSSKTTLIFFVLLSFVAFVAFVPVFASLPSISSQSHSHSRSLDLDLRLRRHHRHPRRGKNDARKFEIAEDMFWKDGKPFQIIGGDLHYFRVLPEYWEDRLLRAKALGLNTIQTYIPWNLHEPEPGKLVFEGIADLESFLKLCQKLGLLVMLRAGPYICAGFFTVGVDDDLVSFGEHISLAEWDLGGFPAWLLAMEPTMRLRSSDPAYLQVVEGWWGVLLPKVAPLLYGNGGPIIMVQIENEFGSYGDDKAYLRHLVKLARGHLGEDIILYEANASHSQCLLTSTHLGLRSDFDKIPWNYLGLSLRDNGKVTVYFLWYTTDGGTRETLEKGTIQGADVFSAVDFTTGDDPWPIFKLQKEFNSPGKSPPLSAEFYTGWLTHWGEKIARTDANLTAAALENIVSRNGSVVLYMAHGGTNFGFYNGANTGVDVSDYKPDLTSYDYDAPISESGDVENEKFKDESCYLVFEYISFLDRCVASVHVKFTIKSVLVSAIRRVLGKYSPVPLPSVPSNIKMTRYGSIQLQQTAILFNLLDGIDSAHIVEAENPTAMEYVYQMYGFLLYVSEYASKPGGSKLVIPKVHDRAQVFISCSSTANEGEVSYVGIIERWSNQAVRLPNANCVSNTSLFILVENMGRVNYGPYVFDRKGILSSVYVDGRVLKGWKLISIPFHNLNEAPKFNPVIQNVFQAPKLSIHKKLEHESEDIVEGPSFYTGHFIIDTTTEVTDTYISFKGWGKGIAFVNEFNIGRYWPTAGPQCNLYIPAPILRRGENILVIFELESPNPELVVHSLDQPDFTCGSSKASVHQL
ncbi:Glycoside hydrolase, family 35 [Corchorus olitorius]|uniref:Beta-galactosidase n=1 Tax=Corchorus olitorius TaxID=93759 RepID=A0A1R3H7Q4_9ROSI|nr:Glycoside hydrolase, family 35 [Corchorus olitorius]